MSEYGAGSDRRLHSLSPRAFDFSSEYQQEYLEHYLPVLENTPYVCGGAHWNFIDFSSALRDESMPRINNKGLVRSDRTPKDVYYYYQAMWRDDIAVLHIASRDWKVRSGVSEGDAPVVLPVKVYTNLPEVELFLDGVSLGKRTVENCNAVFEVPFCSADPYLSVCGEFAGRKVWDGLRISFRAVPDRLDEENLRGLELAVNVGSACFFTSDESGLTWVPDRPYEEGGWGYVGGQPVSTQTEIHLTADEAKWFDSPSSLPLLISDHLADLMQDEEDDPIRRQFVPQCRECDIDDSLDPLAEVDHSVTGRLIHRYGHRAALLTTDRCFSYCRHCFRRRFTGTDTGPIGDEEIDRAAEYLAVHREIYELLLTGGDLFTLSNAKLDRLFSTLRSCREDLVIRLCTRAVASCPSRFDDELMEIIARHDHGGPFLLLTQFNHPRELTDESIRAVGRFLALGIPAFNQSVLLRGVNDDADILEDLCVRLLYSRIKPYYLFQCDLVGGTAHLRVPVARGLEIEQELRRRLSGLAMPQYTIDLPEGGGKVILTKDHLVGEEDGYYVFSTLDGGKRRYPKV